MTRGLFTFMTIVVIVFLASVMAASTSAASIGAIAGIDPTGVMMVGAIADVPMNSFLAMRMQLSFSVNSDTNGLLLVGGMLVARYPTSIFTPFFGVGGGVAVTPRGFSFGMTLDGIVGAHIMLVGPVGAFVDLHYIVRFTATAITSGPLYEAGISLSL